MIAIGYANFVINSLFTISDIDQIGSSVQKWPVVEEYEEHQVQEKALPVRPGAVQVAIKIEVAAETPVKSLKPVINQFRKVVHQMC